MMRLSCRFPGFIIVSMFAIANIFLAVYADDERMATINICGRFGRNLQRVRKKKNMKQIDLSVASGLTRSYISQIENGRQEAGLKTNEKLANGMEIPLAALFRNL